jgi:hypothetical protein
MLVERGGYTDYPTADKQQALVDAKAFMADDCLGEHPPREMISWRMVKPIAIVTAFIAGQRRAIPSQRFDVRRSRYS